MEIRKSGHQGKPAQYPDIPITKTRYPDTLITVVIIELAQHFLNMLEIIINWLKYIPKEYIVIIVGALPIAELRGALPLGLSFGMPLAKAFWLSVLGNILPIAPALFLLEPVSSALRKFKLWSRFFDWLFERTRKKADTIQKYEALGLAIFVAIPLPMTGAWSGVVAASLFKIRFRYAFIAIVAGVIGAGLIVAALCMLGIISWGALVH